MVGMRTYRRAAHTVDEVPYHFVFTPKYCKPVLRGEIALEVRDLSRVPISNCQAFCGLSRRDRF